MSNAYRVISADSHVNEPPGLYVDRVPSKYRDRVPHVEHRPEGYVWIVEGASDPLNVSLTTQAGFPFDQLRAACHWDEVRKGGWDPAERLKLQDQDAVSAEILYPTPRLSMGVARSNHEPEFHLVMMRAYNDWLSEFCSIAPQRLIGIAHMPTSGIDHVLAEFDRTCKLPGIGGVALLAFPNGGLDIAPEDDRFWARCQELDWPVNIHVGFAAHQVGALKSKLPGDVRFYDAPTRIMQFMFSDVFVRFPRLKVGFIEVDIGWVPYLKEQLDDRYMRIHHISRLTLPRKPSEYMDDNIFYTYINDPYGIANRHRVGIRNILWSSDFPHIGADWPDSRKSIDRDFVGVPSAERDAIVAGNAMSLYHLK